jgi:hypothetical protein
MPKGMTKVTPKKRSFVSFSSQIRKSLCVTDNAPLASDLALGANPARKQALSGRGD